jgi:hypothetical protein
MLPPAAQRQAPAQQRQGVKEEEEEVQGGERRLTRREVVGSWAVGYRMWWIDNRCQDTRT